MGQLKETIDKGLDAFEKGLRGDAPPAAATRVEWALVIIRDALLALMELVLTGAGVFTYMFIDNGTVKVLLMLAILISALRTYVTVMRIWRAFARPRAPFI